MARRYSPQEKLWLVEKAVELGGNVRAVWEAHRASKWPNRTHKAIETLFCKDPDFMAALESQRDLMDENARRLEEEEYTVEEDGDGNLRVKGTFDGTSWQEMVEAVGLDPDDFDLVKLSLNVNGDGIRSGWIQLKPRLVIKSTVDVMLDSFYRMVGKASTPVVHNPKSRYHTERYMGVLGIPDLHLGKLAWAKETGENYDLDIAVDMALKATGKILGRMSHLDLDLIQIPLGHDFFHVDTILEGKIPATFRGTAQDTDGRWQKAWDLGTWLAVRMIEQALLVADQVEVVQVPGNHDTTKNYMLARFVEAWFRDDERVLFDISPDPRKYTRWGNTALMHTHGEEKPQNLAHLFQIEAPRTWGETLFREILMGHLHKKREWMDEEGGVVYNRLGSLSGADAWHHEQGWKGATRTARGIVYSSYEGRVLDAHFNVVPWPEERDLKEAINRAA